MWKTRISPVSRRPNGAPGVPGHLLRTKRCEKCGSSALESKQVSCQRSNPDISGAPEVSEPRRLQEVRHMPQALAAFRSRRGAPEQFGCTCKAWFQAGCVGVDHFRNRSAPAPVASADKLPVVTVERHSQCPPRAAGSSVDGTAFPTSGQPDPGQTATEQPYGRGYRNRSRAHGEHIGTPV